MPTIEEIAEVGRKLIHYSHRRLTDRQREMALDETFHEILTHRFGVLGKVERQHYLTSPAWARPKRIDFRIGGVNPVALEFAVRASDNPGCLYGSQNHPELLKLMRFPPSQVRLRCLLLIDLADDPLIQSRLKPTYDCLNGGRGQIPIRQAVRVLYVHRNHEYHFIWRP
jgi:hypothetical protein